MTEAAKAAMAAKRAATIAAKGAVEAKVRKPREPMTAEAKAAMAAKRAATIAAKKGLTEAVADAEPEAEAEEPEVEAVKPKRKGKAKKAAGAETADEAAAPEAAADEAAADASDANVVQDAPAGPEAEPLVEEDAERADAYRYILMIQSTGLGATAIPGHLAADRNLDLKVAENYVIDFIHNFKSIKERYGSTGGYGKGYVGKEVKRREKAAAPKVEVPAKPQPKPRRWA